MKKHVVWELLPLWSAGILSHSQGDEREGVLNCYLMSKINAAPHPHLAIETNGKALDKLVTSTASIDFRAKESHKESRKQGMLRTVRETTRRP